jgi:hypothetical protein
MTSNSTGELTTDIDLALTVRFLVERCIEIQDRVELEEYLGRALTVLGVLDDGLQRRREDAGTEECPIEAKAEKRTIRRTRKRTLPVIPPVEVVPFKKLTLLPALDPLPA